MPLTEPDYAHLPTEEARLLRTVINAFKEADADRTERAEDWLDWYAIYRNEYDFGDDFPFSNQMVPPIAFSLVETVVPRMVSGLFGARRFLAMLPRDAQTDPALAKMIERMVHYQLTSEMDMVPRALPWIKGAAIYGTAISEVGWEEREEERIVRRAQAVSGESVQGMAEVATMSTISRPSWTPLDVFDFWIDPLCRNDDPIRQSRYCIRREIARPASVEQRMKSGVFDNVPEVLGEDFAKHTVLDERDYREERREKIGLTNLWADRARESKEIELLHHWGEYKDEGGQYHDLLITVANRRRVIRAIKSPFGKDKPFIHVAPTPDPNEFYGISVVEAVFHMIEGYIATWNQMQDSANLQINQMYLARDEALLDPSELLYPRPGGVVRVDPSMDRGRPLSDIVQPIMTPDLRGSGFQVLDLISRMIDRTSGQFDYTRGSRSDTANQTATGIMSIIGEANQRFQHQVSTMQHQFIKRLGGWLLKLNARYLPPGKIIRVLGEEGYEYAQIRLDALEPEYDVEPIGAPMLGDKGLLRQQLLELTQVVSGNPALAPYMKPREHLAQIYDLHDLRNTEGLLKTDRELEEEQEAAKVQMAQEALQQQQMQAAGVTAEDLGAARQMVEQGGSENEGIPEQAQA